MAEETVAQFLGRRERELLAQVSALRGQLAPKEAELAQVQKMRALLPGGARESAMDELKASLAHSFGDLVAAPAAPGTPDPYSNKTIKELVIQALLDHFPLGGTAAAIRDFIRDAYGRTIEPGSMRSQMHRLKADRILQHDAEKDCWDFATGKRALYDTYRQVPSANAMPELQDENPEDEAFLEAARKLAWKDDDLVEKQASNNPPQAKPPSGIKRRVV
jgi:hypothetical protein